MPLANVRVAMLSDRFRAPVDRATALVRDDPRDCVAILEAIAAKMAAGFSSVDLRPPRPSLRGSDESSPTHDGRRPSSKTAARVSVRGGSSATRRSAGSAATACGAASTTPMLQEIETRLPRR